MRLTPTLAALLASVATLVNTAALSQEVALPAAPATEAGPSESVAPVATPERGASMNQVEARYGAPAERHAAIGNPPITRWDYPGFSVFFEYQHVVHSVVR